MIRRFLWSLQHRMRGSGVQLQPWTAFTSTPDPTWFSTLLLWMILWITWGNDLLVGFPQYCGLLYFWEESELPFSGAALPWLPAPSAAAYGSFLTRLLWESHHSSWPHFRDGKETSFPVGLYPTSEVGVCWWKGCKRYFYISSKQFKCWQSRFSIFVDCCLILLFLPPPVHTDAFGKGLW